MPKIKSIVTGRPASAHGIQGNCYLDLAKNEPVVLTGPKLLQVNLVMSAFSRHGARVASVTAKDKPCHQLQKGRELSNSSASLSSQHPDHCMMDENGIEDFPYVGQPLPDMYSADLSLLEKRFPDTPYVSRPGFIQQAYATGHPEADRFYAEMDARFGKFEEMGAIVALTADHGMNEKTNDDGTPPVV